MNDGPRKLSRVNRPNRKKNMFSASSFFREKEKELELSISILSHLLEILNAFFSVSRCCWLLTAQKYIDIADFNGHERERAVILHFKIFGSKKFHLTN